jgi:hypothetical protein
MKKLLLLLVCIISVHSISLGQVEKQIKGEALSADEKKKLEDSLQGWKFGGLGNMTLSQAAFVNWSPGGINSIALLFRLNFYADYKKNNHLFQSWLNTEYGIQFLKENGKFRPNKNADRWEMFAKYGYKVHKPLYIAAYGNLRSQFNNTNIFRNGVTSGKRDSLISTIGSPLIFEGAIGLDYVPNTKFSLFFSPLATKVTYVGNNFLASQNVYGNSFPSKTKTEFGAVLIATYKQSFWKDRVSIMSVFRAYKNYLRANVDPIDASLAKESKVSYRKNIDIDWQTTIGFNVNKYLTASVFTHLVWDHDVKTPVKDSDPVTSKPQIQFRDIIGISVGYSPNFYKAKGAKAKAL